MKKSVFTPLYQVLRQKLIEMREEAELTQRALAEKVKREHSFVARIELGERRVDLVEFFWLCQACGQDPRQVTDELLRAFQKLERKGGKG